MAQKSSVYLADETLKILAAVKPPGEERYSLSGRINTIVGRYGEIVRRSMPELSLGEWCAICDANNGTYMDGGDDMAVTMLPMIWANVADSPGIGEKWDIDADALVTKMRSWTYAESVAVAELIQRFWSDCSKSDNAAWLAECGAKIAK